MTKAERNKQYYQLNKEKEKKRGQEYREENKEKELARGLRYRHSVTRDWIKNQLEKQENRCSICKMELTDSMHLDHNHSCCSSRRSCDKCRRSLLCEDCNLGLGRFKDSIEILSNAIEYLRGYSQ
jgi:hypothetical protein